MSTYYDKSHYYIDFSDSDILTDDEKIALEKIQEIYRPVERAIFLAEYRILGKITDDDYYQMTSLPYEFN
jgi:hypothetical protein